MGQSVWVTREGGRFVGVVFLCVEKMRHVGDHAVMMRTVWGMMMRFMVATLPVVWAPLGLSRVVLPNEILFMVLKHERPPRLLV